MQLRVLFTCFTLAASGVTFAQKVKLKPNSAGKDTVTNVGKALPKAGNQLLASNSYAHVPLAGEKSYFGEKNDFVNDFVRRYMENNNRTLGYVQNNSATPFSVIDNILEQKKMPKELKYLAVIESALNHNAVSHAGAVGPWQMMETTAKMMGLTVTRKKDERKDWEKSTNAATKYLDQLYGQLNDWLLVIAAYNSGPTPVQRAIEKTGSHNFWDIKEYLPQETQGHVLAFIATASIFENLSKFISLGSIPMDFKFGRDKEEETLLPVPPSIAPGKDMPVANTKAPAGSSVAANAPVIRRPLPSFTDEELKNMCLIKIDQPISFEIVELHTGIDKKMLARWNPDFDQFLANKYPTPFYKLKVPKDKLDVFLQKKETIIKASRK